MWWICKISPLEFIPLLEESDLIIPVGRWVLDQALKAVSMFSNIKVQINMSYVQVLKNIKIRWYFKYYKIIK